jgi:glycosyltransferase 2 family protein
MKKALLTILQYVIFLGLGIWLVYYTLHKLTHDETQQLEDAILSINPWYLIPIFIVGFFSHFFRAIRWRYLLETADMKPTLMNTTLAVLIGYIANLLIPRAGEVAKCTVLAKYEKMPAHKMIGTIVAERAFDIFCLLVIAFFAFLLQFNVISGYVGGMKHDIKRYVTDNQTVLLIILGVLAALFIAAIIVYKRNRQTKVGRFMKEMAHGVFSIIHMKRRWEFIGWTALIWLMYLMQIFIGLKCLSATHHLTILSALVVLVYGSVGMIITQGGIGAYPLMVAQMLAVYGISHIPALAFGWIAWSVQTAIIILLGLVALLSIHSYNNRRNAKAAVGTTQDI